MILTNSMISQINKQQPAYKNTWVPQTLSSPGKKGIVNMQHCSTNIVHSVVSARNFPTYIWIYKQMTQNHTYRKAPPKYRIINKENNQTYIIIFLTHQTNFLYMKSRQHKRRSKARTTLIVRTKVTGMPFLSLFRCFT